MSEYCETKIINQIINGNIEMFKEIVRMHGRMIYNLSYRLSGNETEAKDLTQDVFLNALKSIKNFRQGSSLSTWLHTITVNCWINLSNRRKRVKFLSLDKEINGEQNSLVKKLPDKQLTPEEKLCKRDMESAVQNALLKLIPEYRVVIILKYIEDKSYEEIAKICKCSIGTVGSRLSRALDELRKHLKKTFLEE